MAVSAAGAKRARLLRVLICVVWAVAAVVAAGCLFAAAVGYSSWGGREPRQLSTGELVALLLAAASAPLAAAYVTRLLRRLL